MKANVNIVNDNNFEITTDCDYKGLSQYVKITVIKIILLSQPIVLSLLVVIKHITVIKIHVERLQYM